MGGQQPPVEDWRDNSERPAGTPLTRLSRGTGVERMDGDAWRATRAVTEAMRLQWRERGDTRCAA